MENEKCTAVILAAGRGKRMNSKVQKQYLQLHGYPVLYYAIKAFEDSEVDKIILVTGPDEVEYCKKEIVEKYGFGKIEKVISGGKERYHSVYRGLQMAEGSDYVLIHDGARPFVTKEIIERTLISARQYGACVAGMPVKDTIKIVDVHGFAETTPDRQRMWQVQTPQTFSYPLIYESYQKLIDLEKSGHDINVTDDAMVLESLGNKSVKLVEGSYENIKITTPSDLQIAEQFCIGKEMQKNEKHY